MSMLNNIQFDTSTQEETGCDLNLYDRGILGTIQSMQVPDDMRHVPAGRRGPSDYFL